MTSDRGNLFQPHRDIEWLYLKRINAQEYLGNMGDIDVESVRYAGKLDWPYHVNTDGSG
jgi:hypothetical protein